MKTLIFLATSCFLVFSSTLVAQKDTTYHLTVEALVGSSLSTISVYEEDDMNIIGFTGGLRIMWEPDNLLFVGMEGGLLHLAHSREENIQTEFGITKRANSLNAYPLMIDFIMKIWKLDLALGLGAALIKSRISAFDDVSESSVITSAKMYGIGYTYILSDRLSIGGEFKRYTFSTPEVIVSTLQIKTKFTLLAW